MPVNRITKPQTINNMPKEKNKHTVQFIINFPARIPSSATIRFIGRSRNPFIKSIADFNGG